MKNLLVIMLSAIALAACSYSKEHPPTEHHVPCSQIKDNLNADSDLQAGEINWNSPGQKAQLLREYKKYDCDNRS